MPQVDPQVQGNAQPARWGRLRPSENALAVLLTAGVFATLAIAAGVPLPAKSPPRNPQVVAFDPPSHDFGTAFQSVTIRRFFRLVNRTDEPMKLAALKTTCSCTLPSGDVVGTIIPPRRGFEIPVDFKTGARDGPSSSHITALLVTGGGLKYIAVAELRGIVSADFTVEPRTLDFGSVEPGEAVTREVVFTPKALKSFAVKDCRILAPHFQVAMKQPDPSGGKSCETILSVVFNAPVLAHRQTFSGRLLAATSSQRVPQFGLDLRACVCPDIDVEPNVLVIPPPPVVGDTLLRVRSSRPSQLTCITVDSADGKRDLYGAGAEVPHEQEFGLSHIFSVSNASVVKASSLTIHVVTFSGTDRTEARSVSVRITSLYPNESSTEK